MRSLLNDAPSHKMVAEFQWRVCRWGGGGKPLCFHDIALEAASLQAHLFTEAATKAISNFERRGNKLHLWLQH